MRMETLEQQLVSYFSDLDDIEVVYLFGSEASGLIHPESDVDIALLYRIDKIPGTDQLLQIQDDITSLIKKKTDIIVLNNASPIIRMQVLRKGKKLIEHSRSAYITFFVRTVNEYDDLKRVRSVIEKKIERGRIYG